MLPFSEFISYEEGEVFRLMKGLFFYDKFSLPFPTSLFVGKTVRRNNPVVLPYLNFQQISNESCKKSKAI